MRQQVGKGIPTITIKAILRGFSRQAGQETILAYNTAMEMPQNEQERVIMDRMYK